MKASLVRFAVVVAVLVALPVVALPIVAAAQTAEVSRNEFRALINRLDQLERQLQATQRQAARGGPVVVTGPSGGAAPTGTDDERYEALLARQEAMRSEYETQLRELTGNLERARFEIDRIAKRVDKLVQDVDFRLATLEKAAAAAPAAPAQPSATLGASPAASPAASPPAGSAPAAVAPAQASAGPALPEGDAKTQYDYAYGLVRRLDYEGAERVLRSFIERHPDSELTENARYWLGETYYVRKNYPAAAETFLEGYRRNKDGRKAADNLLKLGYSLSYLGQKQDACATLRELLTRFATAPKHIRDSAEAEQKRVGCS